MESSSLHVPRLPAGKSKLNLAAVFRGYVYVTIAAVCWAISGVAGKHLFASGMLPQDIVQLRVTFAALFIMGALLTLRPAQLKVHFKDLIAFVLLGAFGLGINQLLYFLAIRELEVGVAVLLEFAGPPMIIAYLAWIKKERQSAAVWTAVVCSLLGCILLIDPGIMLQGTHDMHSNVRRLIGIAAGLGSAITFALYSLQAETSMQRYSTWTVFGYGMTFAALLWNAVHPPLAILRHTPTPQQWLWLGYIAVGGTLLPWALYFSAIRIIRASHASITATMEPVAAAVFAYLFLNETLRWVQIVGGVFVITAVALLQAPTFRWKNKTAKAGT